MDGTTETTGLSSSPHLRLTPSVVLNQSEVCMEYDEDKVDEMVLALLHLTTFKEGMDITIYYGVRYIIVSQ